MLYHTVEGRVQVGDSYVDYAAFGRGAKPLLLLPGLNLRGVKGAGLSLAWMYRLFAREYRVYVLDRKEKIAEGCTIWDLAEDVACAMAQLNIANADVIGISQGGMIAQALAIWHPQRVNKLVLGVTAGRCNDTTTQVVGGWIRAAQQGAWHIINTQSITLGYSESYQWRYRWLLPLLARLVKPGDGVRFIRLAESILTFDALSKMEKITCPVLVLGGGKDQIVTGAASLELAEKLNAQLFMYDQLGHAAYDEAKDFNQRMLTFLRQS